MASCNLNRAEANDPFYGFLYEVNNAMPSNEVFCCFISVQDPEKLYAMKV